MAALIHCLLGDALFRPSEQTLVVGRIKIKPSLSRSARCVRVISYCMFQGGFKGCRVLHLASDKQHERTILCSVIRKVSELESESESESVEKQSYSNNLDPAISDEPRSC